MTKNIDDDNNIKKYFTVFENHSKITYAKKCLKLKIKLCRLNFGAKIQMC